MGYEMIVAVSAVFVSMGGAFLNYYKLKDDQKTWEQEQDISIEKKLLFRKLKKRFKYYDKVFLLLGNVRDIEYPKHHHIEIEKDKKAILKTADALLEELYGKAGLFMEYETRSIILKTYQISYRYANDEAPLSELIDSYYNARRYMRKDLLFDDTSGSKTKEDILKDKKTQRIEKKMKAEKEIWAKKGYLAHSSRPGYPNASVPLIKLNEVTNNWKEHKIKSIICLLSNEEINMYYKSINCDLIAFYKKKGFDVFHISIDDFQKPPVDKESLNLIDKAYANMQGPVLVHCGAGQDRTGQTIEFLSQKYDIEIS